MRVLLALVMLASSAGFAADYPIPAERDVVLKDFKFTSGERLAELRMHCRTLGEPRRDAKGVVRNAVLILHGTTGSGGQFIRPEFAGELFGAGQLLDATKYFIVLPDGIGHGQSSKPSDGMRAKFPRYGYLDMVEAQRRLLVEGFKVNHLRLVMGTSMGGMHTWLWGELHPDFMDALMPLACLPVQIAGRNRMWRKMTTDAIRNDPAWLGGEYKTPPREGMRTASDFLILAGQAPLLTQKTYPTRDAVDAFVEDTTAKNIATIDANDFLYQVDSSRNYDPSAKLGTIKAPVMWVNSADDFINPPELGIAEREVKNIPHGTFVLIPISDQTHGHGTHTWAALWQDKLAALLKATER